MRRQCLAASLSHFELLNLWRIRPFLPCRYLHSVSARHLQTQAPLCLPGICPTPLLMNSNIVKAPVFSLSHFALCLDCRQLQVLWYIREIVVPDLHWNQSAVTGEVRSLHADKPLLNDIEIISQPLYCSGTSVNIKEVKSFISELLQWLLYFKLHRKHVWSNRYLYKYTHPT